MIRLIIAGTRDFIDYDLMKSKLANIPTENIEIVSGCARGADRLGEQLAKEKGIPVKQFPADWEKHGKSAGYKRNEEMAKYATHLIAILDLSVPSKGTRNMIKLAKKYGLLIRIIYVNCENDNYGRL